MTCARAQGTNYRHRAGLCLGGNKLGLLRFSGPGWWFRLESGQHKRMRARSCHGTSLTVMSLWWSTTTFDNRFIYAA